VAPGTLIPRPETECLVENAFEAIDAAAPHRPLHILELGTGSGAVVTALAKERPGQFFYASDRFHQTLSVARRNVAANGLAERIHFFTGDWFAPVARARVRLDLVVSNPPYIDSAVIPTLQPEIHTFGPRTALDGGPDGLDCIRGIIQQAPDYLQPGGCLLLETGHDQHPAIDQLVRQQPEYAGVAFAKDYSGYDRIARLTLAN